MCMCHSPSIKAPVACYLQPQQSHNNFIACLLQCHFIPVHLVLSPQPFPASPTPLPPVPTGAYAAGLISEEQRYDIVKNSCPGAGACGGMYTANTMASAIEALGMSLPYSSSVPAEDPLKKVECRLAGR